MPPPTPINLPRCNPQLSDSSARESPPSVVQLLQGLHRATDLNESHLAALGIQVHTDAPAEDVVPHPSYLPPLSGWDGMTLDDARRKDETFRRKLVHGGLSPEARVYMERRAELSVANQAAFRTVRRLKPEPGKQPPRLGNCYEFFKQMEMMAAFWDDTSLPPLSSDNLDESPAAPPPSTDAGSEQPTTGPTTGAAPESNARSEPESDAKEKEPERVTYRSDVGSNMPPEFRHNMISAFIKLVSYDFGCNVVPPRVEPRLQLLSPPRKKSPKSRAFASQVASYFPCGCVFLCKMPVTREAARAGVVEGPIAAVSARNITSFSTPEEANVDFGRELIAALITAQHRAREGQPEKRFGEGKWWATEKRWGGGEGGPIGREVDGDGIVGDKDVVQSPSEDGTGSSGSSRKPPSVQKLGPTSPSQEKPGRPMPIPMRGQPLSKKPRKNMSIYDNYRMIRLPMTNWDKKTKFEAIGKVKGADYDDVFVMSSLFHHLSILRVRVPTRLLSVLGGEPEDQDKPRSWGKLEIWRSKWHDLFLVEERLEAVRLLWGIMTWAMRKDDDEGNGKDTAGATGDVLMKDV